MKIQDALFLLSFVALLISRKSGWFVWAGILSLVASIPLFATWTFFTAERLTWYAATFFAMHICTRAAKNERES